ncbi:g12778 [Coccomyxa viridis]|uniref:G12778 protein n=1 Tax=Coccomyxa viridis TaxID=1274662 RepID=A0ABP1GIA6_9CHLO
MRGNIVRHLLLASSGAKHKWVQSGLVTRQLQRRSLQLAVLRGNDNNDSHSVPLKALLVDAAGTLISPSEPVAQVYLDYARDYGCTLTEKEVLQNFRRAFSSPWTQTLTRYVGDGRPFWSFIVSQSTGCSQPELLERLYQHFAHPSAWDVYPGAQEALKRIRATGTKMAVVSNFDLRLRPLLEALKLDQLFDALIISAEVGAEKPNPVIFEAALQKLGVQPAETVHVGDDRRNDISGARHAGCHAWLWGADVRSFDDVAAHMQDFNNAFSPIQGSAAEPR